jgi:hypothetical protein
MTLKQKTCVFTFVTGNYSRQFWATQPAFRI